MTVEPERPDPDVSFEFEHDPAAPRGARRALDPLLADDAFAESVKLAASEMVSNVVQHTADGGRLDAWDDDPLLIEVSDHELTELAPVAEPSEAGGRGLLIVDHTADDWGVSKTSTGKVVWAQFRRPDTNGPDTNGPDTNGPDTNGPGDHAGPGDD